MHFKQDVMQPLALTGLPQVETKQLRGSMKAGKSGRSSSQDISWLEHAITLLVKRMLSLLSFEQESLDDITTGQVPFQARQHSDVGNQPSLKHAGEDTKLIKSHGSYQQETRVNQGMQGH